MLMRCVGAVVVVVCASGFATAANSAQPRDPTAKPPSPGGRVSGRVLAADTGRPIARAFVTIGRPDRAGVDQALTDDHGEFVFARVAPGAYVLTAGKRGAFVEALHGQAHPRGPAELVEVTAGLESRVEFRLQRAGAISGRVFDESGDPLPFAAITATSMDPAEKDASPGPLGFRFMTPGFTSNDRGEYRVFGLSRGEYLVSARLPGMPGVVGSPAPLYYPGVTDPAHATPVQLLYGQELINLDFALRPVPIITVSGVAVGPDGTPVAGAGVALVRPGSDAMNDIAAVASTQPDGSFTLKGVAPGEYRLRARYTPAGLRPDQLLHATPLTTTITLTCGEEDITGIFLKLTPGATLAGRFTFEGEKPSSPARFRVMAETGEPGQVEGASPAADGSFVLRGLPAGQRRLVVMGPGGWILKGIYLNGRDIADYPLDLRDDVSVAGLNVVLTSRRSPMTVSVAHQRPTATALLVIFPEDPGVWHARSRRIHRQTVGAEPVIVEDLPPGAYLVVALSNATMNPKALPDSSMLEQLRPLAERVELVEGTPVTVRLQAKPLPRPHGGLAAWPIRSLTEPLLIRPGSDPPHSVWRRHPR